MPRADGASLARRGLEPPLDTVWIHIKDLDGMRVSSERAKRMGFQGKMCIYPPQVAVVNEVYSPSAAEIEHSERVVTAFREAEKAGSSSIQLDGYFIDYPIRLQGAAHPRRRRGDPGTGSGISDGVSYGSGSKSA